MRVYKEAAVTASGTPDEEQLAQINEWAKTPLRAEEVYTFRVRLCDDRPDRDYERFDTAALPKLAELFRGKTGIVDHNWSAEGQVARVYRTEVCADGAARFIAADCYMLRTEKNADLIAEIEGGIKKEVSVGCAVAQTRCGICGAPYGTCEHRKGAEYAEGTCYAVLCDPTDAYEFSFVAVPAQRQAGVMKAAEGGEDDMSLDELVQKNGTPALCESLAALKREAALGRQYRDSLVREVVAMGAALESGVDAAIWKKSCGALDCAELLALKTALERSCRRLFPAQTQLPRAAEDGGACEAAYLI